MKMNKGFTLIELVISMLVIAVAMLGFAALMALSSRSIHSGYTKSAGTNIVQGFVRVLQNNRNAVVGIFPADAANGATQDIDQTNYDGLFAATYPGVGDMLGREFDYVTNMPGLGQAAAGGNCGEAVVRVTKNNFAALDNLATYSVQVHFAYMPMSDDKNVQCPTDGLVSTFCPFDDIHANGLDQLRINNNIVCDTLRTTL